MLLQTYQMDTNLMECRETDLHIVSESANYSDVIFQDWSFSSVDKNLKIEVYKFSK